MISISREKLFKPEKLLELHTNLRKSLADINSQTSALETKIKIQSDNIACKKREGDQNGALKCLKIKKFSERAIQNLEEKRNKIEGFLYVIECFSMGKFNENRNREADSIETLKNELAKFDENELLEELEGFEDQEIGDEEEA